MTSVNVPERMNELTDGTVGSVDAATGVESGPYRKSRFSREEHLYHLCSFRCFVGSWLLDLAVCFFSNFHSLRLIEERR
jgi:hypothetical protein